MLVRTAVSDYYQLKSSLVPLGRYGGVLGHVLTSDSRAPLVSALVWAERPRISPRVVYHQNLKYSGYDFVAGTGLASAIMTWLTLKPITFGENTTKWP